MHMRVPETGKNNAAFAGNRLDALGRALMRADSGDHPVTDQNGNVLLRWRVWRGVDSRVGYRQVLRSANRTQTEQEQRNGNRSHKQGPDHRPSHLCGKYLKRCRTFED
jgi:hypothetical protein